MATLQSQSPEEQDLLLNRPEKRNAEDLELELKQHQQRLLELQRQQEEVERRKQELEDLNQRRHKLVTGQKQVKERIARAMAVLERSEHESRKEIEFLQSTRENLGSHLDQVTLINPSDWDPEELDEELSRALSVIENASVDYSKAKAKIEALSGREIDMETGDFAEGASEGSSSLMEDLPFPELVRRGLGLSLPLIIVLILISLAFLLVLKG